MDQGVRGIQKESDHPKAMTPDPTPSKAARRAAEYSPYIPDTNPRKLKPEIVEALDRHGWRDEKRPRGTDQEVWWFINGYVSAMNSTEIIERETGAGEAAELLAEVDYRWCKNLTLAPTITKIRNHLQRFNQD